MPIHCCAMQGRVDALQMLLAADKSETILQALRDETKRKPPSVVHLAIANDCVECAQWWVLSYIHVVYFLIGKMTHKGMCTKNSCPLCMNCARW